MAKKKPRLVGIINRKYVIINNRLTESYKNTFGFYCDLYYPKNNPAPNSQGTYQDKNIFQPHVNCVYGEYPDKENQLFTFVGLYKKENVNTDEDTFDSFYAEEDDRRPFIETSKENELQDYTKVVVYLENSKMYFYVDKKRVINGADGHHILRMYLSALAEN
jgi:hypothetical protein